MKKESKLKAIIGSLLTAVLATLGFSSCNSEESGMVEYGTPHADFQISGLVDDEAGMPVENARVISRPYKAKYIACEHPDINGYSTDDGCDTVYTDVNGHYDLKSNIFPEDIIELVVEDPETEYETVYKEVDLEYKGGSGWYQGKATATVDFTLKKAENKD